MLMHRDPPRLGARRDTPALRAFVLGESNPDWDALVDGAALNAADPALADEPEPAKVRCPGCGGSGVRPAFGGHGLAAIPFDCPSCDGDGEVYPEDA